jgi:hypothetical protein
MTTLRLTNDQWQTLKLFARGRDAGFITEALQIPRKDVVSTITTVAAGDPEKAAQVVAAYEKQADLVAATHGNLPVRPAPPTVVGPPAQRSNEPTGVVGPAAVTRSILERGAASDHARTRALADKIHVLLAELHTRVQTEEHERLVRADAERKKAEAAELVEKLARELAEAQEQLRELGGGKRRSPTGPKVPAAVKQAQGSDRGYDPREVREWAADNGVDCPARGRFLPKDVIEAWRAATGQVAA